MLYTVQRIHLQGFSPQRLTMQDAKMLLLRNGPHVIFQRPTFREWQYLVYDLALDECHG
jgi:hypothetical protein